MRIGFIGGNGHHYLKGVLTDGSIAIDAVAWAGDGRDIGSAKKSSENAPGDHGVAWFDDAAIMLDEFKPDVVSVGAVYAGNGDMACQALERDIPVVSDKPIATSWEQLEKVQAIVEGTDRVLCTEFDFRSRPCFRAARDAVAAGRIGQPVLATAQKSYRFGAKRPEFYKNRDDYGGTILWIASHGIDAVRFVSGRRFAAAFGMQGNLAKPDYGSMEDHTVNLFELDNGAKAVVHADFLRAAKAPTHGDDRLRLVGSDGQLEVRDERCILITHEDDPRDITDDAGPQPIHQELLAACRGEATDLYGTANTLELAAVMLAARDAADGKKVVAIR